MSWTRGGQGAAKLLLPNKAPSSWENTVLGVVGKREVNPTPLPSNSLQSSNRDRQGLTLALLGFLGLRMGAPAHLSCWEKLGHSYAKAEPKAGSLTTPAPRTQLSGDRHNWTVSHQLVQPRSMFLIPWDRACLLGATAAQGKPPVGAGFQRPLQTQGSTPITRISCSNSSFSSP